MPWGLAGLWNTWTDTATGEVHESYTMLTMNADALELGDVDPWLAGTVEEARTLLWLPALDLFDAGPANA